jgi:hypothetical protein
MGFPFALISSSTRYLERTKFKDEFVRDERHKKTTTAAVTGLPTAK